MNKTFIFVTVILFTISVISAKYIEKNTIPAGIKERLSKIRQQHRKSVEQKAGMDDGGMNAAGMNDGGMNAAGMDGGMDGMNDVGCGPGVPRNATTFCCPNQLPNVGFLNYLFLGPPDEDKKSISISSIMGSPAGGHVEHANGKRPKPPVPQPRVYPVGYTFTSCDSKVVYGTIPFTSGPQNEICIPQQNNFRVYGVGNYSVGEGFNGGAVFAYNATIDDVDAIFGVFLGYNTSGLASPGCLNCAAGTEAYSIEYSVSDAENGAIVFSHCNGTVFATYTSTPMDYVTNVCLPSFFSGHSDSEESYWFAVKLSDESFHFSDNVPDNGGSSFSNCSK